MSEFELGVMAGWAAGVVTAGAVAGAMGWWRDQGRVVAFKLSSEPRGPVAPDEGVGLEELIAKTVPKILCPECWGFKEVPFNPVGRLFYRGPKTIPCGCCKGRGVIEAPPKKP